MFKLIKMFIKNRRANSALCRIIKNNRFITSITSTESQSGDTPTHLPSTADEDEIFEKIYEVDFSKIPKFDKLLGSLTVHNGSRMNVWKKDGSLETLIGPTSKFYYRAAYQNQVQSFFALLHFSHYFAFVFTERGRNKLLQRQRNLYGW